VLDRAALAALIVGAVTLSVVDVGKTEATGFARFRTWRECFGVADWRKKPTESSYVIRSAGKYIIVLRPSPHIDEFSVCLGVQNILGRNGGPPGSGDETAPQGTLRSDKCRAGLYRGMIEVEPGRGDRGPNFAFREHSHVLGRGVPAILPLRSEVPLVFTGFLGNIPKLTGTEGENERSFVGYQRLFRKPRLSVGDAGQNYGEHCDDKCSDSRNGSVVLVQERASAEKGYRPTLEGRHNTFSWAL
jgi:hypothetical protein